MLYTLQSSVIVPQDLTFIALFDSDFASSFRGGCVGSHSIFDTSITLHFFQMSKADSASRMDVSSAFDEDSAAKRCRLT